MALTKQEEIVLNFIGAYRESWPPDLAAALEPLAEDAYYQIVVPTIAPVVGRNKIFAEHVLMKQKSTEQRHDMKSWGSNGNTVFTERVDWSRRNGKWSAIPLVAVFELNDDGEIIAWREYLDLIHISKSHGMTADELIESLDLEAQTGAGV